MGVALSIATYFIIWWLVLFIVLPMGVRDQQEEGEIVPGTPASAPARPQLLKKAILTTVISAVVFAAVYTVLALNLLDGETLDRWFGIRQRG